MAAAEIPVRRVRSTAILGSPLMSMRCTFYLVIPPMVLLLGGLALAHWFQP